MVNHYCNHDLHILKKSGFDVALAGNIGKSFSESVVNKTEIYVLGTTASN